MSLIKSTLGPDLKDVYKIFGILYPLPHVCILGRSIILKSRNLPYYICIWGTLSPSSCSRHFKSMALKDNAVVPRRKFCQLVYFPSLISTRFNLAKITCAVMLIFFWGFGTSVRRLTMEYRAEKLWTCFYVAQAGILQPVGAPTVKVELGLLPADPGFPQSASGMSHAASVWRMHMYPVTCGAGGSLGGSSIWLNIPQVASACIWA